MQRNQNFTRLPPNYLFVEIQKRVQAFKAKNPNARVISLCIGDTSLPIPRAIGKELQAKVQALQSEDSYQGYGPPQGDLKLREKIAKVFYLDHVAPDEIFISDGAKCDTGRLQTLFGPNCRIALQNPTYPVYLDSSLLMGQTKIITLPCSPQNGFFPDLSRVKEVDIIYFCSPNNPTGVAATRAQLEELVAFARKRRAIIIFDSAYRGFIRNPDLPRSIYEIDGAEEVAIEVSSFSKLIGFTGVRLGWTVVPKALKYDGGQSIHGDWCRLISTLFNGASNIAQAGGLAALTPAGLLEMKELTNTYLENTKILKKALQSLGYPIYGGEETPYLWVDFGQTDSWTLFEEFLEKHHLLTTPGVGFGTEGNHFLRFSAFGRRSDIIEAAKRITHARACQATAS